MSNKPISFEEARFRRALEDIRGGSVEAQFRAALQLLEPDPRYVVFSREGIEGVDKEVYKPRLVYDASHPKYRG